MLPDYVRKSIDRLKTFEPEEGYFVAFSGGKDSQCIYHLCEMAGVKFDAHYSVTSVDPPELVRFVREKYTGVQMDIPHDKDGKPVTMWNLIPRKKMPPTRHVRYCCSELKERAGAGRVTVTGVRWAESDRRKKNQGAAVIVSKSAKIRKEAEKAGADFVNGISGNLILNDDNDISRRMVEQCYRTHKTLVNPIVDWTEEEVWNFLRNVRQVESCELYQQGAKRIGCIGCPMAGKARDWEFERWPKYKDMYLRAFDRMIAERATRGKRTEWQTAEEVFDWWMERGVLPGQMRMDEFLEVEE